MSHIKGNGRAKQSNAEAAKYFLRAASLGHSEAQMHMSELHRTGEGVSLDYDEANKWLLKVILPN